MSSELATANSEPFKVVQKRSNQGKTGKEFEKFCFTFSSLLQVVEGCLVSDTTIAMVTVEREL